jgi:hypothetical protein
MPEFLLQQRASGTVLQQTASGTGRKRSHCSIGSCQSSALPIEQY